MKSKCCKSSAQHKKTSNVRNVGTIAKGQQQKKSAYLPAAKGQPMKKRKKWKPLNVHLAGMKKPEAAAAL